MLFWQQAKFYQNLPDSLGLTGIEMEQVSKEFVNRMCELMHAEENQDVKFVVGETRQIFKGHHLVLSTVSSYLADNTKPDTSSEAVVVLEDIAPNVFAGVLRYIYTGQIVLTSIVEAVCVGYVAQKFAMDELWHQCLYFIKMFLSKELVNNVRKLAAHGIRHPEWYPSNIRYSTRNLMRHLQNIEEDFPWESEEYDISKGVKRKLPVLSHPVAFLDYISHSILLCRSKRLAVNYDNLMAILAHYWRCFHPM